MNSNPRRAVFRTLKSLGVHRLLRWVKGRTGLVTLLCLHRVSDDPDPSWPPMTTAAFAELMAYVAQSFEVIPLRRLRQDDPGAAPARPRLILTFDDGYKDFVRNALPVLQHHRLPAVHNVVVECVETGAQIWTQRLNAVFNLFYQQQVRTTIEALGRRYEIVPSGAQLRRTSTTLNRALLSEPRESRLKALASLEQRFAVRPPVSAMMDWDDLRRCLAAGVEIGSHTLTHDALPTIADPAQRHREIAGSQKVLCDRLGAQVDTIAFPNGEYDQAVVAQCVAAGYRNLLTVEPRYLRAVEIGPGPLLLPRILVGHGSPEEDIFNVESLHTTLRWARYRLSHRGPDAPIQVAAP